MEAESLKFILIVIQAIVLVFALAYTGAAVRAIAQYITMLASNNSVSMGASVLYVPAILWGIFYILVKSSVSIRMLYMAATMMN